jgi:adenosylcobinamide-GDP ribazoletransferase
MNVARAASAAPHKLSLILDRLRLAAGFLTVLPVLDSRPRSAEEVAASFGFFPLVGFAIGSVLVAVDWALASAMANGLRAVLVIVTLVILTGAIHLDGLADTADALGAGTNQVRALEILHDSRIGTFGTVALFMVLLLKIAALAETPVRTRAIVLFLAPGWSRWAMVAVAHRMRYLRTEGAGAVILQQRGYATLALASVVAIGISAVVHQRRALQAALITITVTWLFRAFYSRWLGGVTGDLIGAAGELVETALFIALAI